MPVLSIQTNVSGTEVFFNRALLSSRVTGPVIGGIHRYTLGGFAAIFFFVGYRRYSNVFRILVFDISFHIS